MDGVDQYTTLHVEIHAVGYSIEERFCQFEYKGNKLIAQIDSQIHFDNFKSEVRRLFSTNVVRHSQLSGFWYFETDADLYSDMQQFVDSCNNMYVTVRPNPVVEIQIKGADSTSKRIIKTRLQNYYSQLDFFEINEI